MTHIDIIIQEKDNFLKKNGFSEYAFKDENSKIAIFLLDKHLFINSFIFIYLKTDCKLLCNY